MDKLIEDYKDFKIKVIEQKNTPDPLTSSLLGTIAIFHADYELGHTTPYKDLYELELAIKALKLISLPVYMVHSKERVDITTKVSKSDKNAELVGYIYADNKTVNSKFQTARMGRGVKRDAEAVLAKEVSMYNAFLHDSFYGYVVVNDKGEEVLKDHSFISPIEALTDARSAINVTLLAVKAKESTMPLHKTYRGIITTRMQSLTKKRSFIDA